MAKFPEFPTPEDFILTLAPEVHVQTVYNGFPDPFGPVVLAQSAYETGWGKYIRKDTKKGVYSYNLFNITKGNWKGPTIRVVSGGIAREFRVYNNFAESIADYFSMITTAPRYADALKAKTPSEYIKAVSEGGWDPHNPNYAKTWTDVWVTLVKKAIQLIEGR